MQYDETIPKYIRYVVNILHENENNKNKTSFKS
jgi:hypothetical protein